MRGLVEKKAISMANKQVCRYERGMAAARKLAKVDSFIRALRMFAQAGSKSPTSLYTFNDDVFAYQNEKANVELWLYSMRRNNSCR
jgi:hypothetical protein